MKTNLLFFCIFFAIFSCKNNDNTGNDRFNVTNIFSSERLLIKELVMEDGVFYHDGKPFTGIGLEKKRFINLYGESEFDGHNLNWERNYVNGIIDGVQRAYYKSGQLATEYTVINKLTVGSFKKWFDNGQLQFFANYNRNSELEGVATEWDEFGNVIKSKDFINGIEN